MCKENTPNPAAEGLVAQLQGVELAEGEVITAETLDELSNGKEENEDE